MSSVSRRHFLGAALAGMAATPVSGASWWDFLGISALTAAPARSDTLFLTWQRDPTTTMTAQWLGPNAAHVHPTVAYAIHGRNEWLPVATQARPFADTKLSVFRAEMTGLTPDTEYQLRVGGSLPVRFRTMPARATDAFHFISGGDCGVDRHAVNNNVIAARQDPMFALIGGDLGYDNGRSAGTALRFIRNYSRHMIDSQGRLIPLVVCIGNHEVRGSYGRRRADAPFFLALFDGLYAERTYATLDFGDYLSLVLLDTGHVAPIPGEQTDWLDRALRERADRPHLIVVNHVPAYPSYRPYREGVGTGADNRRHWVPLFQRHQVDVVLEHHDHTFKRTHPLLDGLAARDGILYLGDGSWGKLRAPSDPERRPYLATARQDYHLSLHRLEGEQRFHMALTETGRIIDVYLTRKRPRHRPKR
jgi:hypothetical protein